MPRVHEYQPEVSSSADIPRRRATAEDFGGDGGLGAFGKALSGVGDIVQDNVERQEVSAVQANLAKARADWTINLQQRSTTAAVGDPTFASKFNDDFQQYLDKMGESVQTRAGDLAFKRGAGELAAHFVQSAGLHQAQSMALKAKQDYNVFLDSSRNALLNDPTQFDSVMNSTTAALNDPSGTYARMSAEDREKLLNQTRKELALSTVQGIIRLSPELGLKQLSAGKWDPYLDADKKNALEKSAEVGIRAKAIEAERLDRALEREHKDYVRTVQEGIVQKLGTNKLTVSDILESDLPAVGDGSKEHFLNLLHTRSKERAEQPIRTVPSVMFGLFDRIHAPAGDPRKITDENEINGAFLNKQLSFEDMSRLRKEVADARTPEGEKFGSTKKAFVDAIKPQILKANPFTGILNDPSSGEDMYRFEAYVNRQVEAYKKDGKNPYDLLDPSKPDYLGKPEVVKMFAKPFTAAVNAATARLNPDGAAPAAPKKRSLKEIYGEKP